MMLSAGLGQRVSLVFFLICLIAQASGAQPLRYVQIITVESEDDAERLEGLLRSGQDFGTSAEKYSTHPSAVEAGYWELSGNTDLLQEFSARLAEVGLGGTVRFRHRQLGHTFLKKVEAQEARSAMGRISLEKGNTFLSQGRVTEALEAFKTAVSRDPTSALAHMMLGYCYRLMGSYEMIAESKAELRQAVALDPALSWARFYLARIYIDLGRIDKAKEELAAANEQEPQNPFFIALMGDANRLLGDPELSIQQNRRALELSPGLSLAHYYLGLALTELGRKREARQELERAVGCAEVIPEMHLALGSVYLGSEEYPNAIQQFEQALQLDPTRAETRLLLARTFRRSGRLDVAESHLAELKENQHLQIHSPHFQNICAEASYESGMIFQTRGELRKARDSYMEALRVKQDFAGVHHHLAEVLFELKDYSYALLHATQAEALGEPIEPSLMEAIRAKAVPK